jgi:RNA polymerase sigma factor (TIGR02999 family)
MRQILTDQARRKASVKHGGKLKRVDTAWDRALESPSIDILALDEALERLERDAPEKARMVMLRYFAGLNEKETAAVLGLSLRTLQREWRFVRVFLFTQLSDTGNGRAVGAGV